MRLATILRKIRYYKRPCFPGVERKTRYWQQGNSRISVGRYTYGVLNLSIYEYGEGAKLDIGAFCCIGNSVTIYLGGNHRTDWMTTYPFGHIFERDLGGQSIIGHPKTNGDVVIGNDVWIGRDATIMSGISIGDGAVIAANSHVVKNVMPYEIVGGNPARPIKKRFSEEIVALLLELHWWTLPSDTIRHINRELSQAPSVEAIKKLIAEFRN